MEENKEIMLTEKKSGAWKNVLIIVLLLAVVGLGGYICYDKLINKDPKTEEKVQKEEQKEQQQDKETVVKDDEKSKEEIADINAKLGRLNLLTHFALDYKNSEYKYWFTKENIEYNKEVLKTDAEKMDFVFGYLATSGLDGIVQDEDINGEEVTGAVAVPFDMLKKYYKDLLGLDLKDAKSYPSNEYGNYNRKGNLVYGAFWTGYTYLGTFYKYKNLEEKDGKYILTVDVLAYNPDKEGDFDKYSDYDDHDKNDYPESLVSYKLQIKLTKVNDELYTINSMQFLE